jgi:hypothetical protein
MTRLLIVQRKPAKTGGRNHPKKVSLSETSSDKLKEPKKDTRKSIAEKRNISEWKLRTVLQPGHVEQRDNPPARRSICGSICSCRPARPVSPQAPQQGGSRGAESPERRQPEIAGASSSPGGGDGYYPYTVETLGSFLGWIVKKNDGGEVGRHKVEAALNALGLIEKGVASKETFTDLTSRQARTDASPRSAVPRASPYELKDRDVGADLSERTVRRRPLHLVPAHAGLCGNGTATPASAAISASLADEMTTPLPWLMRLTMRLAGNAMISAVAFLLLTVKSDATFGLACRFGSQAAQYSFHAPRLRPLPQWHGIIRQSVTTRVAISSLVFVDSSASRMTSSP